MTKHLRLQHFDLKVLLCCQIFIWKCCFVTKFWFESVVLLPHFDLKVLFCCHILIWKCYCVATFWFESVVLLPHCDLKVLFCCHILIWKCYCVATHCCQLRAGSIPDNSIIAQLWLNTGLYRFSVEGLNINWTSDFSMNFSDLLKNLSQSYWDAAMIMF